MSRPILLAPLLVWIANVAVAADPPESSLKPQKEFTSVHAAHLLRRAGFGGTPAEADRLAAMGLEAAVEHLVEFAKTPYQIAPPVIDPAILEPVDRQDLRRLSDEERERALEQRRRKERAAFEETRLWWIDRMLNSPRPFEEKMTLFWHGHFTSGMREVRNAVFLKEQNEFLRAHALENFHDLLLGISKDRAMLVYLDGNRNVKAQPNENYARELLELFSLGVGNYTEADIKSAARAFTGWGFDDSGFSVRDRQHDTGVKTFLGRTGKLDGDDVIDVILEQRACARFLATKLLRFFVMPDPSKKLVEALAREIERRKFELKPAMQALLSSEAFYSDAARASMIKSPVELIVGTARTLNVPVENFAAAERALASLGQELMQPPNVKGWDGNEDWINTATLFGRYNAASALVAGSGDLDRRRESLRRRRERRSDDAGAAEPAEMRDAPRMMSDVESSERNDLNDEMQPVSRLGGNAQKPYDPFEAVERERLRDPAEIVGYFATRLLASGLSDRKQQVLIDYLSDGASQFDPAKPENVRRLRTLVQLICSTPEYQLN